MNRLSLALTLAALGSCATAAPAPGPAASPSSAPASAASAATTQVAWTAPQDGVYDVLIRGGRIVDGTGSPWYRGDVAIRGDRIAAVGLLPGARARDTIDATGLVVAPGF